MSRRVPRLDDDVEVECWCRAEIVRVPVRDVRAGRTRSCGRRGCKEET